MLICVSSKGKENVKPITLSVVSLVQGLDMADISCKPCARLLVVRIPEWLRLAGISGPFWQSPAPAEHPEWSTQANAHVALGYLHGGDSTASLVSVPVPWHCLAQKGCLMGMGCSWAPSCA